MTATRTYTIGARQVAKGDILEIETINRSGIFPNTPGSTYVGKLVLVTERGKDDQIGIEILRSYKGIKVEDVRSVRVLTPEQCAARYAEGDNVRIQKFSGVYHGVVTNVGRTRVTVKFQTNKDRRERTFHEMTVPAHELVRVSS